MGTINISATITENGILIRAITGTRTVLLAFNVDDEARSGLLGFAIKRSEGASPDKWLRGHKAIASVVPNPRQGASFSTFDRPIQGLLWSDYTARTGTEYTFKIVPVYGHPNALDHRAAIALTAKTEVEWGDTHSVFFNRHTIASQAFAARFQNAAPAHPESPDDPETKWLSRGLLEACPKFIDDTKTGETLRVAAYESTYEPIIRAFKRAIARGVDVMIVHEAGQEKIKGQLVDTDATKSARNAIDKFNFPAANLIARTRRKAIPHNKFIVRIVNDVAQSVWTGSTNFTESVFLGQANVGHVVVDTVIAGAYLDYWNLLKDDPAPTISKAVSPL